MLFKNLALSFLIAIFLHTCRIQPADLIISNGKIITMSESQPQVEAIAIRGDKIVAMGSSMAMDKFRSYQTRVIDAHGELVLPGFIDAHCHFAGGGESLLSLDFRNVDSIEKIQQMIEEKTVQLTPGSLIKGENYDHSLLPGGRFPGKADLDVVSPNNPVIITRVDGHSCWVNSLALQLSHITAKTPDPFGGEIMRDLRTGEPTGILKETAMDLLRIQGQFDTDLIKNIEMAMKHAAQLGITGIHTSAGLKEWEVYRKLKNQGKLTLRVYAWQYLDQLDTLLQLKMKPGDGDSLLRVGFLKSYIDGSLGSGTALFFEPYEDDSRTSGLAQYPEEVFYQKIARAHREGYQTGTHAIGTRGVNWALNAVEYAQGQYGKKNLRHRIEHAQHLIEQDFPRFAYLDVIASMQPSHCSTDMRFCESRIGSKRSQYSYAWRSMSNNGVHLAFGSDWPVEPLDPLRGIYAAVTRKNIETGNPPGGWFPEQRLSVFEAIKGYTIGSAYASFEEEIKGSLEPGKLADIIMLDKDLFTIAPEEILKTKVLYTLLGGKIIYRSSQEEKQ